MLIGDVFKYEKRTLSPCKRLSLPAKIGLEIEVEGWSPLAAPIHTQEGSVWEVKDDGSLRNSGMEYVSKGHGLDADVAVDAIEKFCKDAVTYGLCEGYPRAGIHAHIDCTDLDISKGELANLLRLTLVTEPVMFQWVGEWRKWCGFSDTLTSSDTNRRVFARLVAEKPPTPTELSRLLNNYHRYAGTNLQSLTRFGTVEHRQLGTTFDASRIINWIDLNLHIKKVAKTLSYDELSWVLREEPPHVIVETAFGHLYPLVRDLVCPSSVRSAVKTITLLTTVPVERVDWSYVNKLNPFLANKGV